MQPRDALARNNRGLVLKELKRYGEALDSYDGALALKPDYAQAWCNRGIVLLELERAEDALASLDRALALHPRFARKRWGAARSR